MNKICTRCKKKKILSDFPKCSRNKDGYNARCKKCMNKVNTKWRKSNIRKFKKMRRLHYKKNIDRMRKMSRKYSRKNKRPEYYKKYRHKNKKRIRKYQKKWERKKRKTDINYRIKANLRGRINHALNGASKSAHTFELLGCDIDQFKKHIENLFQAGMRWDNYGKWHLDHKIPCYTFDLTKPCEQKKCFHFTNHRPLWAADNLQRERPELRIN